MTQTGSARVGGDSSDLASNVGMLEINAGLFTHHGPAPAEGDEAPFGGIVHPSAHLTEQK
jgi:hypothetical protein